RVMRVEHEYERGGGLAYLAAWDGHQAPLFGRREPSTGVEPFRRAGGGGVGLSGGRGRPSGPPFRPLRAVDRDRTLRQAGGAGDDRRAVRLGQAGVLGGRQRLQPSWPGLGRPTAGRMVQPPPDPPAGPCLLAEPDRDLLLDRATQGPDPQRLPGPRGGPAAAGPLPRPPPTT